MDVVVTGHDVAKFWGGDLSSAHRPLVLCHGHGHEESLAGGDGGLQEGQRDQQQPVYKWEVFSKFEWLTVTGTTNKCNGNAAFNVNVH